MKTRARLVLAFVAAIAGLTFAPAAAAALLGPSPYSGTADSPFSPFAGSPISIWRPSTIISSTRPA